jgi:hypothetical protein
MSTLTTIRQLVKEISALSNSLSDSVPKGTKDDKIWSVMNSEECETPHETFNRRFDALFAEDCRDSDGHLHHVRQGKLGMGLVVSYLSKINWTSFPLDLVELKLQRLVRELNNLQCVPNSIVCNLNDQFDQSSGDPIYPDQYVLSTLLQSSRMQTTLRHPNSPSSAKPWKISIFAKHKVLSRLKTITALIHQPRILTRSHPLLDQLNKTSVASRPSPTMTAMQRLEVTITLGNVCLLKSEPCLVIDSPIITAKKRRATASTSQAKGRCGTSVIIDDLDLDDTDEDVRPKGMFFLDIGQRVLIIALILLQVKGNVLRWVIQ